MFFPSLKFMLGFKMDVENSIKYKYQKIEHETEKAWQIVFPDGLIEWFPKSHTRIDKAKSEIFIPKWIAESKDLPDPE